MFRPGFQRPRRFLLSMRENTEPTNASAVSTSRVTRPESHLIDSIETDDAHPPPANTFATSTSRVKRPVWRLSDDIESDDTPSPPKSRKARQSLLQSRGSPDIAPVSHVAVSSSSRSTHQPTLQHVRNAGSEIIRPTDSPSTSATRGPKPFPLPSRRGTESTTTPTISTSPMTYQAVPQHVSNAAPSRTSATSTSRIIHQSMPQPTRNAIAAHTPTTSAPRTALQSTAQSTRSLPGQNPSASSSRTPQQPTFRLLRAPVRATAAPANTPPPSASAPILEFICLYTSDLRRKKKRWQDGKLKFHTFNKKYMVYDEGGSFVGDGHWQGDESEFAEGLEMNLDRGMAIVQVLECTGTKEQDLTEVLGKRAREVEERRMNAVIKNPATTASSNPAKRSRGMPTTTLPAAEPAIAVANISVTAAPIPQPRPPRARPPPPPPPPPPRLSPPRNGGAWSKHAVDLLGMTRPDR